MLLLGLVDADGLTDAELDEDALALTELDGLTDADGETEALALWPGLNARTDQTNESSSSSGRSGSEKSRAVNSVCEKG